MNKISDNEKIISDLRKECKNIKSDNLLINDEILSLSNKNDKLINELKEKDEIFINSCVQFESLENIYTNECNENLLKKTELTTQINDLKNLIQNYEEKIKN